MVVVVMSRSALQRKEKVSGDSVVFYSPTHYLPPLFDTKFLSEIVCVNTKLVCHLICG